MAVELDNKYLTVGQAKIIKTYIDNEDAKSIHSVAAVGGKVNFYTEKTPVLEGADATTPAFSWDIPAELVLDTTKTSFYPTFNPAAEGLPTELAARNDLKDKPVLVLGVKTTAGDGTVTYSYSPVDLSKLVDTYIGSDSIEIDTTGANPVIKAKLSPKTDNVLQIIDTDGEKGLYVSPTAADGNKADKLKNVEGEDPIIKENQILVDDGAGNLRASGKTIKNVKDDLIGAEDAAKTTDTINGAKAYAKDAADAVLGTAEDDAEDDTVFGAKKFATAEKEAVIGTSEDEKTDDTIYGVRAYVDDKMSSIEAATDEEVATVFGITLPSGT